MQWGLPRGNFNRTSCRARFLGLGLIAASLAVVSGLCAAGVAVFRDMRSSDFEQARLASSNIVNTIAADIARNIEIFDLSLRGVVDNLRHPEIVHISKEMRQLVLFDRAATAKYVGRIRVTDSSGQVVLDSGDIDPPPLDLSKRDYIVVHKDGSNDNLYISHPFHMSGYYYAIGISRRVTGADGTFAGVVAGTLRLDYFRELFEQVQLPVGSSLALVHRDGTMVMRVPFDVQDIGRKLGNTEMFRQFSARNGHFVATASIDGVRRLYSYNSVGDFPLLVTIGLPIDDINANWMHELSTIGLFVLILALSTLALALFSAWEIFRRARAEEALAVLAITDSLTRLSNRRGFDDVLVREWKRALRNETQVSLLMVDVDHFKLYNDRWGHQAGDLVLYAVGTCIASSTRSSADFAARYGGEEFAVLLPGASLLEALAVAERIRSRVARLRTDGDGKADFPTVSVGVATRAPGNTISEAELVRAADKALYEAKRHGRNQTIAENLIPIVPNARPVHGLTWEPSCSRPNTREGEPRTADATTAP